MGTSNSASREIDASAEAIFAVLADPGQHGRLDPLEMVLRPTDPALIERPGQVFTMHMVYEDGEQVEHYRTDNHVVVYQPPGAIGWATAAVGGSPLGWTWRYDLQPAGSSTTVTLTYDWSEATAENIRRYGVPLAGPDDLAATLARLDDLLTSRA